mmetsp:Transcript_92954/g.277413  ORF Transcript_92954/g.277413 Transcript_92954/m.277413 type:complete len:207 (-) Transcript_92954:322-942(-)
MRGLPPLHHLPGHPSVACCRVVQLCGQPMVLAVGRAWCLSARVQCAHQGVGHRAVLLQHSEHYQVHVVRQEAHGLFMLLAPGHAPARVAAHAGEALRASLPAGLCRVGHSRSSLGELRGRGVRQAPQKFSASNLGLLLRPHRLGCGYLHQRDRFRNLLEIPPAVRRHKVSTGCAKGVARTQHAAVESIGPRAGLVADLPHLPGRLQ